MKSERRRQVLSQQRCNEIVTGIENTLEHIVGVILFQDGEFETVNRQQVEHAMSEAVSAIREWLPKVKDAGDS